MSKKFNSITFQPAKLCEGKEWFISYHVINPATGSMVRKKIKLNRIKSITERRKFAAAVIRDLNEKLYSGWNPFLEETAKKGFVKLTDAMRTFLDNKSRELRPDSMRSYNSYVKKFSEWLTATGRADRFTVNFTKSDALEWMNHLYLNAKLTNRTWNNYRLFFNILWNWLVEQQFAALNVFEGIRKKQQSKKERIVIPVKVREEIREHLEKEDYDFMVVCMLVFHALIRPKEICMLKPQNFKLKEQVITIPAAVSKNKSERVATIPDALMPYLVQWNFNGAANNEYIFSENYRPGKVPLSSRYLSKKWDKLRSALKLPKEMVLYSLRDSGIIQMLQDGISPKEVMLQADHSSLEITSIYIKHAMPDGSEQIKKKGTTF